VNYFLTSLVALKVKALNFTVEYIRSELWQTHTIHQMSLPFPFNMWAICRGNRCFYWTVISINPVFKIKLFISPSRVFKREHNNYIYSLILSVVMYMCVKLGPKLKGNNIDLEWLKNTILWRISVPKKRTWQIDGKRIERGASKFVNLLYSKYY
jgi:hypothetical protein